MKTILVYDATFEGFLTAVFMAFELKLKDISIEKEKSSTTTFFDESILVVTDDEKANRVWKGIQKNASSRGKANIYSAFLSELKGIENHLYYYIKKLFSLKNNKDRIALDKDFSDPILLKIAKVVKMVRREKHRMDAFVRFKLTKDGIYTAIIEPDFNVLPLNASHFKKRYADQKWLIYDVKRNYGIYYDLVKVSTVLLAYDNKIANTNHQSVYFSETELAYQDLWKKYFKSTTIKSRINKQLHLKHIPKRYWKYLSEKC